MATLIIRNLDTGLLARLRERAARNGRSMEEAAVEILNAALALDSIEEPSASKVLRKRY